jgi:hypothetical protein
MLGTYSTAASQQPAWMAAAWTIWKGESKDIYALKIEFGSYIRQ